ncbi:hypothetical protein ACFLZN_00790 [Nanoarchaeota archaeon]
MTGVIVRSSKNNSCKGIKGRLIIDSTKLITASLTQPGILVKLHSSAITTEQRIIKKTK